MADFERKPNPIHSRHRVRAVESDRERDPVHQKHDGRSLSAQQQAFGNQSMQRFTQSCPHALPSPSLCPFGGVCSTCPATIQAKLTVNDPGDEYEQEADQVADQIMQMPEPSNQR